MTSLWRQAFDAVERPLAAAAESWVQTKTFMDLAAVTIRAQRRLTADGQRMTEQWLHAWGMPARGDLPLAELGVGQAPGRRHPVRGGDQVQLQPQYQRECAAQYP